MLAHLSALLHLSRRWAPAAGAMILLLLGQCGGGTGGRPGY
jgi:hypothetical protein